MAKRGTRNQHNPHSKLGQRSYGMDYGLAHPHGSRAQRRLWKKLYGKAQDQLPNTEESKDDES